MPCAIANIIRLILLCFFYKLVLFRRIAGIISFPGRPPILGCRGMTHIGFSLILTFFPVKVTVLPRRDNKRHLQKRHMDVVMKKYRKVTFIFGLTVLALIGLTGTSIAEFYKYTDKDGNTVFVDDINKIPEEYLDDLDTYKQKYDHLPAAEKRRREEIDRRIIDQKASENRAWIDQKLDVNARAGTQPAGQKRYGNLQTKVNIRNNKIVVPVKVGYAGNETTVLLLLDTGASLVVLHRGVADQLKLKALRSGKSQTAGGALIRSDLARLSYLKVGEITMHDPNVLIIDHEGPSVEYQGLLGMNFLRNFNYRIDFNNQVIDWNYQP